jgi:hypothetical protein
LSSHPSASSLLSLLSSLLSHPSSVSPLLGVPLSSSLTGSSIKRVQAAHIPLERGGAAAASSLLRELYGGVDGAHIPQ